MKIFNLIPSLMRGGINFPLPWAPPSISYDKRDKLFPHEPGPLSSFQLIRYPQESV